MGNLGSQRFSLQVHGEQVPHLVTYKVGLPDVVY